MRLSVASVDELPVPRRRIECEQIGMLSVRLHRVSRRVSQRRSVRGSAYKLDQMSGASGG